MELPHPPRYEVGRLHAAAQALALRIVRCDTTAKARCERDIVRLLTLRKWVGTAFGTARLAEFALSVDDALLFRSIMGATEKRRDLVLSLFISCAYRHFATVI